MILSEDQAEYVSRAIRGVYTGALTKDNCRLSSYCTECGVDVQDFPARTTDHVAARYPGFNSSFLIIGCEGYFFIDPNLVGIDRPNWHDTEGNPSPTREVTSPDKGEQ